MKQYDYVVVGGGTAGCIIAARLSEDPAVSVGLIEAGPSDVGDDNILQLNRWPDLLESGYDWDYAIEPPIRGNSFMRMSRAKVLGGCSSHNSCIAFFPPDKTWTDWADLGVEGWSKNELTSAIEKVKNTVPIHDIDSVDPCGKAVLESAAQLGIPTVQFNRGDINQGAGWFQINADKEGIRGSTSHVYLHPILKQRTNLEIFTNTQAAQIIFEGNKASGVRVQNPDKLTFQSISAVKEVIICLGAIDSPKLLLLSGIGPKDHLNDVGIPVRLDLPGVGSNLDDHVEGLVMWEASKPMVNVSSQWWEAGIFTTTQPDLDYPNVMMHYGSVPFDMNTLRWGFPTTENGFCLTPNVTQGLSRGTVRLRTRDFRDRPKVDPRYFTDPLGHDEQVMLSGIKLARKIAAQSPLKEWINKELTPGPELTTDEQLIDYIHKTHNTVYHPASTCKMGAHDDPDAVLDHTLKVIGLEKLRVMDASAMPKLPTVNPNITIMVMAERAAELIKESYRS